MPILMVTLPLNTASKAIFDLTSLLFISIHVKSFRSDNSVQCFAFQRFGYSSLHYKLPPHCVKCPHLAKYCTKRIEEDFNCANCNGVHIANYKKIPIFLQTKVEWRSNKPNIALATTNLTPQFSYQAIQTSNQSSAQPNQSYISATTGRI